MSCAVTVVMVIATAVTWPLYTYVLVPQGLEYLQTLVFILVIAALVQLLETALRKYMPPLYNSLGIYLPLITTNCAVLGVTMLVLEKGGRRPQLRLCPVPGERLRLRRGLFSCHAAFCRGAGAPGGLRYPRDLQGPAHNAGGGVPGGGVLPRV